MCPGHACRKPPRRLLKRPFEERVREDLIKEVVEEGKRKSRPEFPLQPESPEWEGMPTDSLRAPQVMAQPPGPRS